jgi:hypothetical protein
MSEVRQPTQDVMSRKGGGLGADWEEGVILTAPMTRLPCAESAWLCQLHRLEAKIRGTLDASTNRTMHAGV